MTCLLAAVALGPGFAAPLGRWDRDDDGIRNAQDACPTEAEVRNGWRDADGCPDTLGTVLVSAVRDDDLAIGTGLELLVGDQPPRSHLLGAEPWSVPVPPGERIRVRARLGPCLAAGADGVGTEGEQHLELVLRPLWAALVALEVSDPEGRPVPGATLTWTRGEDGCVPPPAEADGMGRAALSVGDGLQSWRVEAEGYGGVEGSVALGAGQVTPLLVTLVPGRVRVTERGILLEEPVAFDRGAALLADSQALLDDVAVALVAHPELALLEIAGHVHDRGRQSGRLSQDRAEAVAAYLVAQGVAEDRLVPVGYGALLPVGVDAAVNDRIELNAL